VTHTYIQAINQPPLHYLTRSVRRASGYVLTRLPSMWVLGSTFPIWLTRQRL